MTTREEILFDFENCFPEIKEDITNCGYDYEEVMEYLFNRIDKLAEMEKTAEGMEK